MNIDLNKAQVDFIIITLTEVLKQYKEAIRPLVAIGVITGEVSDADLAEMKVIVDNMQDSLDKFKAVEFKTTPPHVN